MTCSRPTQTATLTRLEPGTPRPKVQGATTAPIHSTEDFEESGQILTGKFLINLWTRLPSFEISKKVVQFAYDYLFHEK